MFRPSRFLTRPVRRSTYAAIGILAFIAACDRETPTDVARTPAASQASLVNAPSLGVSSSKPTTSSYEVNTAGLDVASGFTGVVEVLCTAGKQVLGGGFHIEGGVLINDADAAVYESSPRVTSGPPGSTGWRLEAANRSTTIPRHFVVWAICASI
jgi:hypothetical protein